MSSRSNELACSDEPADGKIKGTFLEALIDCLGIKHELMMKESFLVEECDEHVLGFKYGGCAPSWAWVLLGPFTTIIYVPLDLWATLKGSILVSCDDLTEKFQFIVYRL